MSKKILFIITTAVILGCTSTSRFATRLEDKMTPPLQSFLRTHEKSTVAELEKIQVGNAERHLGWWKMYRLGQTEKNTQKSCQYFKTLANDKEFPLQEIALLRAHEKCPLSTELAALTEEISPWYQELWADIRLQDAEEKKDPTELVKTLVIKARLENRRKFKEEYYTRALRILKQTPGIEGYTSEQLEESLFKTSPRLNPKPEFKDLSSVANDHRFNREFDEAINIYKKILASPEFTTDEKFQALKNIRQTYKVEQKRNDYIQATADLVNWTKTELQKNKKDRRTIQRFYESQILFARTLWTEDQNSRAVQSLKETHRRLKGAVSMDEVFFILGRIDEEKGNFKKALEYYEASTLEVPSQPGLKEKVLWMQGWNQYKLEQWQKAVDSFTLLRDQSKETSDKFKARFWLSRAYGKLNNAEAAKTELQALSEEDTLGYYGVLAYRELKKPYPLIQSNPEDLQKLSLLNVKSIPLKTRLELEWLMSVQEKPSAEKLLQRTVADLKDQNQTSQDIWLNISSAYARTGLYLPLFATISSLTPEVKDKLLSDHPDLLFPQAYADIINKASERSNVPAEFIFSIIRQESAFDPEARSPADAFGLMQLLPSVAKQIAKRENLPYKKALDLFIPEINVPLGAYELKSLTKRYDGQYILAVSGYNANAAAIRGWLKTRYRPDPVEFIEEVPYEETKGYIKLTMRNYVFYKRLRNPKQTMTFPEELLKFNSL